MEFSEREHKLIGYLLDYPDGLKMTQMEESLHASRRTIYREFTDLNDTLQNYEVVIKNLKHRYQLTGAPENLKKLRQAIKNDQDNLDLTVQQRQSAIAVRLLNGQEPEKMQTFAIDFHASIATISKDLNSLEEIFNDYQIKLLRQKARGIEIKGDEFDIRNLLVAIIDNEINPFEFFRNLANPQLFDPNVSSAQFFMSLIGMDVIEQSYRVIRLFQQTYFKQMSDAQLQRIIIVLAVMLKRMKVGRLIKKLPDFDRERILKDQRTTLDVFLKFDPAVKKIITSLEVNYFTLQMQGLQQATNEFQSLEDYDLKLSFLVKQFVNQVSSDFGWDFGTDRDLYNNLMLIFSNPIANDIAELDSEPVLTDIKVDRDDLNQIVQSNLSKFFNEAKLSDQQLKTVEVLFGNALELGIKTRSLSVLVICPNGIATAQILRNRLLRRIPEVNRVSVARTSALLDLDFDEFDLILSTIELPGFNEDYRIVSPLLLDEEIDSIRDYIQKHILRTPGNLKVTEDSITKPEDFDDYYQKVSAAKRILDNFQISVIDNQASTMAEILKQIVVKLEPGIVRDTNEVVGKLLHRIAIGAVGLPETNLALVHTTSRNIERPFSSIYELEKPMKFPAMGGVNIELKRIVLLLGPATMTPVENDLMASISTLVISNKVKTEQFEQSNRDALTKIIGSEFIQIINKGR
ncbi:PTS sugar transporter subunit IIA [Pediococcus argentinicus]|uniref:BglG family transcription antiterminator n=1 Tax=Pediococcus argentinicus TaxID=480391 RepID=UPI00338F73E0